ncbi:MAG: hypothetical protein B7Z21_01465 [Verrucomicrobiales bacterium 32-60-5]|nr:MAG: hypothetical protein B7Z21_01465 [Verrucomicrobiales bacterium 32-60-5]
MGGKSTRSVSEVFFDFFRFFHPSAGNLYRTMPHDLTSAPATDPTSIYRYRDCLYGADMVTAALSVDFFTWLSANPSSLAGICEHFGFTERPTDTMMTLFAANG